MHPVLRLHDGYDGTSPELRDQVRALQQLLSSRGFALAQDGFFGDGTEEAVQAFQRANELTDDGIVGPRTWAALEGTPPPDPTTLAFPTTLAPEDPTLLAELAAATTYRDQAASAAAKYGIPLCLVGGIGSRESRWGLALQPRGPAGTGDFTPRNPRPPTRPGRLPPDGGGFGRGLVQIDFDAFEFARTGNWKDPAANLVFGAGVLSQNHAALLKPGAPPIPQGTDPWCAALAAYNSGLGNVLRALQSGRDVDYFTAGRNYGRDTLNRAGWFLLKGWT